ncbi:MAG: hypothetical protein K1X88_34115 [Nannocystaceae bacterium]|nr:hypothetical protein [Nannocystaceae bacterium]
MSRRALAVVALLWWAHGCGGPASAPQAAPAPAAAPAPDPGVAARKAEREAKAAAAAAGERDRIAAIDAITELPPTLPRKLPEACAAMTKAYDDFMRKTLSGDMKTKWETGGNEMQLAVFRKECLQRSIPVAACQSVALGRLQPEHKDRLPDVMKRCVDEFGGAAP